MWGKLRTLVLGLGNPILTDDGVGIHVVRAVAARLAQEPARPEISVAEAGVGGLRLLEVLAGYGRAILVDAIQTRDGKPGEAYRLGMGDLQTQRTSLHAGSTHDLTLPAALALGRELGMELPGDADIDIIAIEAEDVCTFGEACTPGVEAAVPRAVEMVIEALSRARGSNTERNHIL